MGRWQRYLELYEQLAGEPFPSDPWQQLERAICLVFESWNSGRAVQYRRARGLDDRLGTAVNVQVMIQTQLAGLLFSRDPLDHSRDTMVVEVVTGLGDQLAAGRQTPQRFLVPRDDLARSDRDDAAIHQDSTASSGLLRDALPLLTPEGLRSWANWVRVWSGS